MTCMFRGCAPPFYSGVYMPGHFNDLASVGIPAPSAFSRENHAGAAVSPTANSLK